MIIVYNLTDLKDIVIPLMCPICKVKWEANNQGLLTDNLPVLFGQSISFNKNVKVGTSSLTCAHCNFNAEYIYTPPIERAEKTKSRPIPLPGGNHGRIFREISGVE